MLLLFWLLFIILENNATYYCPHKFWLCCAFLRKLHIISIIDMYLKKYETSNYYLQQRLLTVSPDIIKVPRISVIYVGQSILI